MRLHGIVAAAVGLSVAAMAQQSPDQVPLVQDEVIKGPSRIEDPPIGFGTWNLHGENATKAVEEAIKAGYRQIDAAVVYNNQREVGKGIAAGLRATGLARDQVWVTSKLWNNEHSPYSVSAALDHTLEQLGLEYLDLYLIHWPVGDVRGKHVMEYTETWKDMTKLTRSKVREIGVSNFSPHQLQHLMKEVPGRKPFAHQFELHPYLPQHEFIKWHAEQGIRVAAYSPLGNSNPTYHSGKTPLLENDVVKKVAQANNVTSAQAVLAWAQQRGTISIVKSAHPDRITENLRSLDVGLSESDMRALEKGLPLVRFNNPGPSWGVPLFKGLEGAAETLGETWDKFCAGLAEAVGWHRSGGTGAA